MTRKRNSMKWKDENSENPLLMNIDLFNATLEEFSKNSFNEASLNDILKAVNMNKGSFYYRFYDKMDLYLSLIHGIGIDKLRFFRENFSSEDFPADFYDQIKAIAKLGLMYARKESRYYSFWRRYLSEDAGIHNVVRSNFKEMSSNAVEDLVKAAMEKGRFNSGFSESFLVSITNLLMNNIDCLISPDMSDEEIIEKIDELALFMKKGLSKDN